MFAVYLLASFALQGMDNKEYPEIKAHSSIKDYEQYIVSWCDLSSGLNLAQTCKNYQAAFYQAVENGSFYN